MPRTARRYMAYDYVTTEQRARSTAVQAREYHDQDHYRLHLDPVGVSARVEDLPTILDVIRRPFYTTLSTYDVASIVALCDVDALGALYLGFAGAFNDLPAKLLIDRIRRFQKAHKRGPESTPERVPLVLRHEILDTLSKAYGPLTLVQIECAYRDDLLSLTRFASKYSHIGDINWPKYPLLLAACQKTVADYRHFRGLDERFAMICRTLAMYGDLKASPEEYVRFMDELDAAQQETPTVRNSRKATWDRSRVYQPQ